MEKELDKEKSMFRTICLTAMLLAAAAPAWAHPGHEASGFLHPFTGIDHLLAMVGVGMWAAFLAVRKPAAALLVPAAFVVMMAAGAAAGFGGIKLPVVEAVILGSVFVIGGLLLGAIRLPSAVAMAMVGLFAVFHGYAHALEAPAGTGGTYILGFLVATVLLQAAGLGLGKVALRTFGGLGLRALGGVVVAGGALVLIAN
jgi:urease accessory protein